MLLGMRLSSLSDVVGKWLMETKPVGQVLSVRSAVAMAVLFLILWRLWLRRLLAASGFQTARVSLSTAGSRRLAKQACLLLPLRRQSQLGVSLVRARTGKSAARDVPAVRPAALLSAHSQRPGLMAGAPLGQFPIIASDMRR